MGRFSPLPALSDLRETRLEKAAALAALGQGPYGLRFEPTQIWPMGRSGTLRCPLRAG